ncbi:PLP-dependent transferase [Fragilariopsis cylindrus CCMP1102]|uniref:PLP-dependent transferase n=1 Tax=Fragilariopsis cylindrus CCMP1102 TaxID=635003 RepID=A0A1E7FYT1_9STRA|nr:PLP-dependent transferase [Fragilariopsis cylindrus CCMP1102]|eukprot:OEU23311.1 PLP-dependent transferase [Fragilariopsis cylindrus CCMP1102]
MKPTDKSSTSASLPSSSFPLSNRIIHTLDPCVVKTKEWIQKYTPLWTTGGKENGDGDDEKEEDGGIFSLAQGIVYWKPPPSCSIALQDAVMSMSSNTFDDNKDHNNSDDDDDPLSLHSYSPAQGIPELVSAIQEKISTEHGMINHDVTVTVGANQAYMNCVLTIMGDNGDSGNNNNNKAIVFAPYYFNHVMAIQMCCGSESLVVGPTDMNTGYPNKEWLKQTLGNDNNIRMVTIVNPGNPTGITLSYEHVKEIVDVCRKHGVWVILDCTYEHFLNDDNIKKLPTFANESHVVHLFSFSKGYSLAGYRCGYLISHKNAGEFLHHMLKVQDTIPIGPPRMSQHIALGALRQGSNKWVYKKYATLDKSREYILNAISSSLPQTLGGSGSMYVMGKLPDDELSSIDVKFCRLLIKYYGVAVIPGSFCGLPGWIRICYANLPPSKTKIAAKRLKKGIDELTKNIITTSK